MNFFGFSRTTKDCQGVQPPPTPTDMSLLLSALDICQQNGVFDLVDIGYLRLTSKEIGVIAAQNVEDRAASIVWKAHMGFVRAKGVPWPPTDPISVGAKVENKMLVKWEGTLCLADTFEVNLYVHVMPPDEDYRACLLFRIDHINKLKLNQGHKVIGTNGWIMEIEILESKTNKVQGFSHIKGSFRIVKVVPDFRALLKTDLDVKKQLLAMIVCTPGDSKANKLMMSLTRSLDSALGLGPAATTAAYKKKAKGSRHRSWVLSYCCPCLRIICWEGQWYRETK